MLIFSKILKPPYKNFRWKFSIVAAHEIVLDYYNIPHEKTPFYDDPGIRYLIAVSMLIFYPKEDLTSGVLYKVPFIYEVFHKVMFILVFILLFYVLKNIFNKYVAWIVLFIFLISSNIGTIAHYGDIYMFPFYAGVFALAIGSELIFKPRTRWHLIILYSFAMVLCNFFRSSSLFPLFLVVLIGGFAAKLPINKSIFKIRFGAAMIIVFATVLMSVVRGLVPMSSHSLWHPLHAGLFEFGAHVDRQGNVYLKKVSSSEMPQEVKFFPKWSDYTQFDIVKLRNPNIKEYGGEHEKILKEEFIKVFKTQPLSFMGLVLKRIFRIANINPWLPIDPFAEVQKHIINPIVSSIVLFLILSLFFTNISLKTWVIFWGLMPLAIPPVLVHSGYVTYNIGSQLPLTIICVVALIKWLDKFLHKRDFGKNAYWAELTSSL